MAIAEIQIDKFAVIIDNLRNYNILDGLGADIYDELHKLRKYRNKIHIQLDVDIAVVLRDEDGQFTDERARWAIDLNWKVFESLRRTLCPPH